MKTLITLLLLLPWASYAADLTFGWTPAVLPDGTIDSRVVAYDVHASEDGAGWYSLGTVLPTVTDPVAVETITVTADDTKTYVIRACGVAADGRARCSSPSVPVFGSEGSVQLPSPGQPGLQ